MAKDRSLVRASDIGSWTFCNRAWWLAEVVGAEHADPARLRWGEASHQIHGRQVRRALRLQRVGGWLLLAGLALALLWLLFWIGLR